MKYQLDVTKISFASKISSTYDQSYITRYTIIKELVNEARKQLKKKQLRILDLGGYNGLARTLLPDDHVTILDVFEDDGLADYIRVDSVGIPTDDDAFDIVISTDVLEHIPGPERDTFMREALRVAKHFVFIGAPFGDDGVEEEELYANMVYRGETKKDYVWLKEHRDYVLPKKAWLEGLLQSIDGISYDRFAHTSIRLWSELLAVGFFVSNNIAEVDARIAARLKKLNTTYFKDVTAVDFPESGYRTFYVISKDGPVSVVTPIYDRDAVIRFTSLVHQEWGWSVSKMSETYNTAKENLTATHVELERLHHRVEQLSQYKQRYESLIKSRRFKSTELLSRLAATVRRLRR